jgi:uncharacterized protein
MNLLWTALLVGFVGSLHCGVMCGPLVLAVSRTRRFNATQFAYHGGRIATYCVVGLLLGTLGRTLALAGFQRWISILAGLFILGAVFSANRIRVYPGIGQITNRLQTGFAALLKQQTLASRFALGTLNGLLPCGLVYVAAAGAAAMASSVGGVLYMAMFGLGTIPMLCAVALLGPRISVLRKLGPKIIAASLALVGIMLVLRGLAIGIPYLSPSSGVSCH